jgi:acetyltransferase-like isoleucine patch superfamily enzyme
MIEYHDIEAIAAEDPEVNPAAVRAITTEDEKDGPEKLIVLAEFGGPRVTCSERLRDRLTEQVRQRSGWKGDIIVEIVRSGWLASGTDAAVDAVECAARLERLNRTRRETTQIFNSTFENNITEAEKDAFGYFGSHAKIRTPASVTNPRLIHLGNWVSFGRMGKILMQTDFSVLPPLIRQHYPDAVFDIPEELCGERNPRFKIGDGSTIGDNFFISVNLELVLGRHVAIADRCYISDANHLHKNPDIPPSLCPNELGKPIHIDDHCWFGVNTVLINGARIGRHCIVSANSVVSGDMPDFSLAVGNPARVVPFNSFGFDQKSKAGVVPNPQPSAPQP